MDGTEPRIRSHPDRDGVRIVDPIENGQFALYADVPVDPEPCGTDEFVFPVSTAAEIRANELRTPYRVNLYIRDVDGSLIAECNDEAGVSVPTGQYLVEFASTRLKLYALVEGEVRAWWDGDAAILDTTGGQLRLGARSLHNKPATTVTTTGDPEDLMAAISTFGSALKTTSPERSFPTLRGHPPEIEQGPKLEIPDGLERPDTSVRIEVPPTLEHVYPVTSLAFYLGATVERGDEPILHAAGESFPLTDPDFESAVERTLKQVFLLDCVTRTEGIYPVELHEREQLESRVDLDYGNLYEMPLGERLSTYLSVPYEQIEDQIPWFRLTAHVVPKPEHAPILSYLADDLAFIRTTKPPTERSGLSESATGELQELFELPTPDLSPDSAEGLARSNETTIPTIDKVFQLPEVDTMEQVYVGEGIPVDAGKLSLASCQQRLEHGPRSEAKTRVAIVHNDTELRDDDLDAGLFNTQAEHTVEVERFTELSTTELAAVLGEDREFLHYIGHIDDRGFRCTDGYLDIQTVKQVGADTFLLNACHSYRQGRELVDRGAISGVVTAGRVSDSGAVILGHHLARLIDRGFSFLSALSIVTNFETIPDNYLIIGNGTVQASPSESGTPHVKIVKDPPGQTPSIQYRYYSVNQYGIGSLVTNLIEESERYYLMREDVSITPNKPTSVDKDLFDPPYVVDGELCWETDSVIPQLF